MILHDQEVLHSLHEDEKYFFSHQVIVQPSEMLMDEHSSYKNASRIVSVYALLRRKFSSRKCSIFRPKQNFVFSKIFHFKLPLQISDSLCELFRSLYEIQIINIYCDYEKTNFQFPYEYT